MTFNRTIVISAISINLLVCYHVSYLIGYVTSRLLVIAPHRNEPFDVCFLQY